MKKPTVTRERKKAWILFSRFVRLRDCLLTTGSPEYGECISCNASLPITLLHAGHYIHKKLNTFFDERNVNAQCAHCNKYESGNLIEYRHGLIERYGEGRPEEIEAKSKEIRMDFTIKEMQELQDELREKIRRLG